jgi:spore coat polysaccharide biosynthesis protein SpsF (cytidylyltransferase family)
VHLEGDFDYTSNVDPPTFPDGLDVEVVRTAALEEAWQEAGRASEREHVTLWLRDRPERFRIGRVSDPVDRSAMRWTVDEHEDFEFVRAVYARLYPVDSAFGTDDILALLEREPGLAALNAGFARDEGLAKSLREDAPYRGLEVDP